MRLFGPRDRLNVTELEERTMGLKQRIPSGKSTSRRAPSERVQAPALRRNSRNPTTPTEKIDSIYDHYDHKSFRFWERKISQGYLPTSVELTKLLKENADSPIPHWLVPIIERRDQLRRRTGRPRKSVANEMQLSLATAKYPRYLAWLRARDRRSGLRGWPAIRNKDWWTGPPHERAARMAMIRAKLLHTTWRTFLNERVNHNKGT
jgi:hypothetical protein